MSSMTINIGSSQSFFLTRKKAQNSLRNDDMFGLFSKIDSPCCPAPAPVEHVQSNR